MKRIILTLIYLACWKITSAQVWSNIQVQYDYGHGYGTITTEIGHSSSKYNGFGFVDFDFGRDEGAYFEYGFNRKITANFFGRIEYNGGFLFDEFTPYAHGLLLGGAYQRMAGRSMIEIQLMYRMDIDYIGLTFGHGIQGCLVWGANLFKDKLYFGGNIDVNYYPSRLVQFGTEMQILYCFRELGVGLEIECENWNRKVSIHPKAMIKINL